MAAAAHFRRPEAYEHAADYLRGLVADVERKNDWQLAEHVGYAHPRAIQRVLDRYAWDADAVRDDLRAYEVHRDRGVVPLATEPSEGRSGLPQTSPPETPKGTLLLTHPARST